MFSIGEYSKIVDSYKGNFNGGEKVFVVISVICLIVMVLLIAGLLFFLIRKIVRKASNNLSKEELLNEIANLNDKVVDLMKEKDELMAMKVSQLGINPEGDESDNSTDEPVKPEDEIGQQGIRFPRLTLLDEEYKDYKIKKYDNNFTLEELIDDFRCFSASELHLYYDNAILRPFFAGLASSKLIILQGISGTGKTSLAYAWGKFVNNDSCVASVEPSWRDKSDFLGYFNEFTKKFNETRALTEIYTAGFDDNVHTIILDEMNLARVEYYFVNG